MITWKKATIKNRPIEYFWFDKNSNYPEIKNDGNFLYIPGPTLEDKNGDSEPTKFFIYENTFVIREMGICFSLLESDPIVKDLIK